MNEPESAHTLDYRRWFAVSMLPAFVAYIVLELLYRWMSYNKLNCDTPETKYFVALSAVIIFAYAAALAYGTGRWLQRIYPKLSFRAWLWLTTVQLTLVLTAVVWLSICNKDEVGTEQNTELTFFDKPPIEAAIYVMVVYFTSFLVGAFLGLLQGLVLRPACARWAVWVIGSGVGLGVSFVLWFLIGDVYKLTMPMSMKPLAEFIGMMVFAAANTTVSALTIRFMQSTKLQLD